METVNRSLQRYLATFAPAGFQAAVGAGEDAARPEAPRVAAAGPVYKFQAVQLTYNFSTPPFLSQDRAELQALFERFKEFLAFLRVSLCALGVSATIRPPLGSSCLGSNTCGVS